MGWQLRPNEVEERGRDHDGDCMEEERERGQTQRKEKRVRWMTKRNEGVREEGGTSRKKEEGTSAIMSRQDESTALAPSLRPLFPSFFAEAATEHA